jgi:CAP-Gly domain-containing linker protein 1
VPQNELEQLRKRLAEAEMKTARVTHDVCASLSYYTFLTSVQLNKEIGELEALVESKVRVVNSCGAESDSIYRFIAK